MKPKVLKFDFAEVYIQYIHICIHIRKYNTCICLKYVQLEMWKDKIASWKNESLLNYNLQRLK